MGRFTFSLGGLAVSQALFFFSGQFFGGDGRVFAQELSGPLEVYPAMVEVVLDRPGEEKLVELTYVNHSRQALNLEIFPIDFKQQDDFGAIGFLGQEAGSYSYSLSSFLSFEGNRLVLDPGEERKFVVLVKDRPDLSPGGHYAAVVARLLPGQETDGVTKITPSISSLILVRKTGGERFNLSLLDLDWPRRSVVFRYPQTITPRFQNEGNIHLIPYGRLEIRDLFDRLLYKGVVNTSSLRIFPSSRRYIKVDPKPIQASLPLSLNSLTVVGQDSLKKTHYLFQESFIYVHPGLLVFLGGALGAVVLKKRRR